jgi:hypothetical protein
MIYNAEFWGRADLFAMIMAAWVSVPLLAGAFYVLKTTITEGLPGLSLDEAAPVAFSLWLGMTLLIVGLLLLGAASCRIVGVCL